MVGKGIHGAKQTCKFLGYLIGQFVPPITVKQVLWMHKGFLFELASIDEGSPGLRGDRTHLHNSTRASVGMVAIAVSHAPLELSTNRVFKLAHQRRQSKFICHLLFRGCKVKSQLGRAEREMENLLFQLPYSTGNELQKCHVRVSWASNYTQTIQLMMKLGCSLDCHGVKN